MNTKLFIGLLFLAATTQIAYSDAQAEEWGDTSYVNPPANEAEVEEIPSSMASDEPVAVSESSLASANEDSYREEAKAAKAPTTAEKPSSFDNISTVRNTYGVNTEEKASLKVYLAPFAGMSSLTGNTTADATPRYAAGANVGLLISSNMMLDASYTYSEQNLSNPRYNTTSGILLGTGVANVFGLKQNAFDAGVKLFFLGRESRFRPFFGGGMGYTKSYLNYTANYQQALGNQAQYLNDFVTNQITGFGEIGAEFAFTRSIVATAMFKLNGVFSSNTSASDASTTQNYDASKLEVGNSLSRTASYTVGAGVGIYF
jgi:hypothetical protein